MIHKMHLHAKNVVQKAIPCCLDNKLFCHQVGMSNYGWQAVNTNEETVPVLYAAGRT